MVEYNDSNNESQESAQNTIIGSIWVPEYRDQAARIAQSGDVIAVYNKGVCALWGDGSDESFPEEIRRIKGEKRGERPLAATMPTEQFVPYIDKTKISPELHEIFLNAPELAARTGSLCFIRAPITEEAAEIIPSSMISRTEDNTPIIQNWDPRGHKPTFLLLQRMHQLGIQYPAVTSMNESGSPEIVTQTDGIKFSKDHNLQIFLTDPKDNEKVMGSYTIIGIGQHGIEGVRNGNIKLSLLSQVLNAEINLPENLRTIQYQQYEPSQDLLRNLNSHQARLALIADIHGAGSSEKIRETVTRHIQ